MSKSDAYEEPAGESDAIILEESRRVLDHQIDNVTAVENTAAWMLRIGVILLGALISAVRLFGVSELHVSVFAGVLSIALSLVVGIVAYSVSDVDVGAGPGNIERGMPDDYGSPDVYDSLLAIHEDSIAFNRDTLRTNELYLTLTQALLVVGVSLVAGGFFVSI